MLRGLPPAPGSQLKPNYRSSVDLARNPVRAGSDAALPVVGSHEQSLASFASTIQPSAESQDCEQQSLASFASTSRIGREDGLFRASRETQAF